MLLGFKLLLYSKFFIFRMFNIVLRMFDHIDLLSFVCFINNYFFKLQNFN